MSRPISKRLLTCSATLYTTRVIDEDRNEVWTDPVELENVWITLSQNEVNGNVGKEQSDRMTLWFDCVNSEPTPAPVWTMGSLVEFEGMKYHINSITPCYGSNGLHHWEIGLV